MATQNHIALLVQARRGDLLAFGPWAFQADQSYTEFFAAEVQLPATTLVQLVGGVSPAIAALSTIELLGLYPDQGIRVGLHGVDAQAAGFTLDAYQILLSGKGEMTSLNVYNTAAVACNLILVLGGS